MKNSITKRIIGLMPIVFILGILAAFLYNIYYTSKLEEQIRERDKTIQELSFRSKLVEDFFDIKYNPADSTTSYVFKDTMMNIITLGNTTFESLKKKYNSLIDDFNSLVVEYNSLVKDNMQERNEKKRLEKVLQMIENKYNISYEISVEPNAATMHLRNTDMVDSGLVLLPYYRDKIERKPNGLWIITH